MATSNISSEIKDPAAVQPFAVRRALIGMELEDSDHALLQYLDFFSTHFPIAQACFLHVVPQFDLLLDSEILDQKYRLSDSIAEQLADTLTNSLTNERIASVEHDVREGSALEALLDEAKVMNTDLILIGQKSLADHHGILGKKLARRVDCDALIVPDSAQRTLKKILVPIDFSGHSIKALQTAVAMNRQLEDPAEIVCMHVFEMPDFAAFNIGKTEEQFRTMIETDRSEALAAFVETHVAEEDQKHISRQIQLKERPNVARYLMDFARTQNVDFIVMGARGHSKIHLLFVGSVTESILSENKKIPTLIVR